jgi:hypothetical protein
MKRGGSYLVDKPGGKPKLVHATVDHPEGNRPRHADGTPVIRPEPDVAPTPAPSKSTSKVKE